MLRPLARLYEETSDSDKKLLKLALLLHDLGKDIGPGKASHVHRSGELAEEVCERFELPAEQRHVIQVLGRASPGDESVGSATGHYR